MFLFQAFHHSLSKKFSILRVDNTAEGNQWKIFTRMIVKNVIMIGFKYFPGFTELHVSMFNSFIKVIKTLTIIVELIKSSFTD